MAKPNRLKGKILFVDPKASKKLSTYSYQDPYDNKGCEERLCDTTIGNFKNLNLTHDEKTRLSLTHRKILNYFRNLSPFAINSDAKKLVQEINQSKKKHIVIEAQYYGVYVCLAALYSGLISDEKRVDFILELAPLALFPKSLVKKEPHVNIHKVVVKMSDDSWLAPFESLSFHDKMKFSHTKTAHKKSA
jgi:hypothetical protein